MRGRHRVVPLLASNILFYYIPNVFEYLISKPILLGIVQSFAETSITNSAALSFTSLPLKIGAGSLMLFSNEHC